MSHAALNHRERAMLRAVATGVAEITCSCEPDLCIDGRYCDATAARRLVRDGFLRADRIGVIGERVPCVLTDDGRAVIGGAVA